MSKIKVISDTVRRLMYLSGNLETGQCQCRNVINFSRRENLNGSSRRLSLLRLTAWDFRLEPSLGGRVANTPPRLLGDKFSTREFCRTSVAAYTAKASSTRELQIVKGGVILATVPTGD
jgi:hypothetical protein